MRDVYLVAYDIRDKRRLGRVIRIMNGNGERLQYSVFLSRLSGLQKRVLERKLSRNMDLDKDQVMFVKLGSESELAGIPITTLGTRFSVRRREAVIV